MLFNSYIFIFIFLPITLITFFLVARLNHFVAASWLMAASLFFYGWWNKAYVTLLLCSVIFNYAMGAWIGKYIAINKSRLAKYILVAAISVDLSLLCYYKYANFFMSNFHMTMGDIVLPLGISFFTFTQIAFLVDMYRGEVKEYNFLRYGLFVTYFPHLIAGPLYHHKEIMPQFANPKIYVFNYRDFSIGLSIFMVGLFKKVVLADNIAPFVSPVFGAAAHGSAMTFFESWVGALAYTLQIYFDFSGYSDMAIGLARLMGVKLPLNFNSPYQATNIVQFWRRWHMTLSRFLKDYLYIPLGGNRKGSARRYLNLMITMFLGGLWHGAGWTFVIWGALHGIYLVINHAWQGVHRILGHDLTRKTRWGNFLARSITFLAVVVGWVFFRANNLEDALHVLQGMTGMNGFALPDTWLPKLGKIGVALTHLGIIFDQSSVVPGAIDLMLIGGLLIIAWSFPNTQQIFAKFEPALNFLDDRVKPALLQRKLQWQPTMAWALLIGIFGSVAILSLNKSSDFLYFQF
jgi:D-alanyl-lipoteichoic acid acyltransferase DltB (MBOAT superfamily)